MHKQGKAMTTKLRNCMQILQVLAKPGEFAKPFCPWHRLPVSEDSVK